MKDTGKLDRIHTAQKMLLFLLFFLCLPLAPFSSASLYAGTLEADENTVFVIESAEVKANGRTSDYFLLKELKIALGDTIIGKADFHAYIADKQQLLVNQRPLDEESELDYYLVPKAKNRYAVHLEIHAEDSWNFIALPYFRYDSNDGLLLSIRTRDYNFFGTLQTLAMNLNYEKEGFTEDDPAEYGVEVDFTLPFRAVSKDWVWNQEIDLTYIDKEPFEFSTNTDFSVTLPLGLFSFDNDSRDYRLTLSQNYYLNKDGEEDEDGWYTQSGVSLDTSFGIPLLLGPLGQVRYGPSVFTKTNYKPGSRISKDRRGVESGFSHSLSAGRIDWKGNFREGEEILLTNTNAYNWVTGRSPVSIEGDGQLHRFFEFGGFSSRLYGFKTFDSVRKEPGGPIRGILDDRVADSDAGAYVNMDFPFKMWIWFMSRWFEAHLSPFFDAAVVNPADRSFDPEKDIWYSAGLEAFSFAKFSRALYLRISLGVDLEAFFDDYRITGDSPRDGKSRYAIFIGLGHHY